MTKITQSLLLGAVVLGLSGCGTTITNLTPQQRKRSANGLYPFEVALDTTQRTIRKDSIQAAVVMGLESFPMRPTPLIANRWETLVPLSRDIEFVSYYYKFDYLYNSIPRPKSGSLRSPTYQLRIVDP